MNRFIQLIALLFLSNSLRADETGTPTAPFALLRDSASNSTQEGLGRIQVDRSLFVKCESDFADLRLFRVRGEEVLEWPFLVRETRPRTREIAPQEISSTIIAFDKTSEDLLVYTVELPGDSPQISKMRIHTPLRNFEKTVSVYAKKREGEWSLLIGGFLIHDREAFVDFRRTDVDFARGVYDQIRIQLEDATDEQQSDLRRVTETLGAPSGPQVTESTTVKTRNFRVDKFTFFTPKKPRLPERGIVKYPLEIISQKQVAENEEERKKETEIILETGTIPINQLALTAAGSNFSRKVRIEIPRKDDPGKWREISQDTIHRYDLAGLKEEKLSLRLPETQVEQIRLIIENGDNRPIQVESAKGNGPLVELVFLTEPSDSWQVAYHAPAAKLQKPKYDTAVLQRAEREGIARESIVMSDPRPNPDFDERSGIDLPPWFAKKWILHTLIAFVVGILIWVLYGAAQKIEAVE